MLRLSQTLLPRVFGGSSRGMSQAFSVSASSAQTSESKDQETIEDKIHYKPRQLRVLVSGTHNPWFNLATEEWLYREADSAGIETLFVWRNDPTVVIGRNQNPWKECNTQVMEKEGVYLARRLSGGGAVYQDLGNTNFTFLSSRQAYSKERNFVVLQKAMESLGLNIEVSGRNDMTLDGAKVSGSAFRMGGKSAFHHGTLLIDVDMSALGRMLNPDKEKMKAKGAKSVVSRVVNMSSVRPGGLTHEEVEKALVEAARGHFGFTAEEAPVELLDHASLEATPSLQKYYEQFSDWDWRFGQTPQFEYELNPRFTWGNMNVHLNARHSVIDDVKIFSDSLHPEMISIVEEALKGVQYDGHAVSRALRGAAEQAKAELGADVAEHVLEFRDYLENAL